MTARASVRHSANAVWHDQVSDSQRAQRWYACHCLSHRESAAANHLRNQQFAVFLPRRRKTRRHARKIDSVLVPLFPGYIFVELNLSYDPWRSVNGTYGVASLIMHGDFPLPVPIGVVEQLLASSDEHGVVAWKPELKPNQIVRVCDGIFTDLVGTLDRLDGTERVRVLLDIMGGKFSAILPRDSVVPADSVI